MSLHGLAESKVFLARIITDGGDPRNTKQTPSKYGEDICRNLTVAKEGNLQMQNWMENCK